MKFGSGVLKNPKSFSKIAEIVPPGSVVVLSALAGVTDQLIDLALEVHPSPPRRELDMLVSVGERISIALFAMALDRQGKVGVSFTGSQSGIITTSDHTEARILDVRPTRLISALSAEKVVIVAGFQGVSLEKEITTLGRGGSDTSAVALGVALNAEKVIFYKDVPGIFSHHPKDKGAKRMSALTYEEALTIVQRTGNVLHPRALQLAAQNGLPLHVRSLNEEGTEISTMMERTKPQYEEPLSADCYAL
ncbi:MAG: aspartate kinase [Chlamydiales bacterium]|nr:aspartate kinase [Chlamydiales bacterium]